MWFLSVLLLFGPNSGPEQLSLFADIHTKLASLPHARDNIGQRMLEIAISFQDLPYIERSLEIPGPEKLVVRLDGFDCFTLVESVLALGHIETPEKPNWEDFQSILTQIRYRDGEILDYTSRLHYTSDWAFDNGQKGFLSNVTQNIGGIPYPKVIDFMTSHRSAYSQLKNDALFIKMAPIEAAINERHHYYIPEGNLQALEHKIKPGDILAITTSIKGLDVSHVGLARFIEGRLHMLHASSVHKRVETTQQPLADYLIANRTQTGILVLRPQVPARAGR